MTAASAPPPELHLPDLPEVAVQLGGSATPAADPAPRAGLSWRFRLQQALSSYLPLLLMASLAAGTWWLVKNTPLPPGPAAKRAERQTPDYTMSDFSVTRFGPDGKVVLRIDGDQLRHFPATDRMEIEGVRIHAIGTDGRLTDATAHRALVNGDATEVQLVGGAQVTSQLPGSEALVIRSDFLHAFVRFERLRTHLPVQVDNGRSRMRAGGLDYDPLQGRLQLNGPVRMVLAPPRAAAPAPSTRR
jgi:lipopolysaccharide export system protein LptC